MYSPKFSVLSAVSIRRLAWAFNLPMTETVEHIVKILPTLVESRRICSKCLDKTKCSNCVFKSKKCNAKSRALFASV